MKRFMIAGSSQRIYVGRFISVVSFCAYILSSSVLHATTPIAWNSASNGNWSLAGNWNPASVPNGDYDVSISGSNRTVALDLSASVTSLTTSGNVTLNGLGNPTLVAVSMSNLGTFQFNGAGSIGITGTLHNTNASSKFILGANATCNVGFLDNSKEIQLLTASTLNILSGGNGIDTIPSGTSYSLLQGAKLNLVNSNVTSDAFENVHSVAGTLGLYDGVVRHWPSLNITGGFSISGAGTKLDIDSFANQGNVSVGSGSILNLNNHAPITEIPSYAGYADSGDFNVVNSGVSTPALSNLAKISGTLFVGGDKNRSWGPLENTGYLDIQGGTHQINGDLTNSGECWISGELSSVTVNGSIKNLSGGEVNIGLFGYIPGSLRVSAMNNAARINMYNGSLVAIGTGTPTLTQGLQIMPDGLVTFDLANALTLANTYLYLDGMPVSLAGTLDMMSLNAGLISNEQTFQILRGIQPGGITGTFSSVLGHPFPGGYWQVNYDNLNGNVSVTALTLPEPACLGLLGSMALFGLRRNNRNN